MHGIDRVSENGWGQGQGCRHRSIPPPTPSSMAMQGEAHQDAGVHLDPELLGYLEESLHPAQPCPAYAVVCREDDTIPTYVRRGFVVAGLDLFGSYVWSCLDAYRDVRSICNNPVSKLIMSSCASNVLRPHISTRGQAAILRPGHGCERAFGN